MIHLLIWILVVVVIVYVALWLLRESELDPKLQKLIRTIIILVALLVIASQLLRFA